MTEPKSFSSMCTHACKHEMLGFLLSLSLHHPGASVIVYCDTITKQYIDKSTPKPLLNIEWIVELDKWSHLDRNAMELAGTWNEFMQIKTYVLEYAINKYGDSLLIDCDTIILDKLLVEDPSKQLGVSPQFITKHHVDRTGYYNGGMLWSSSLSLPARWRAHCINSRYYEQAAIEGLVKEFTYFEYGDHYNLQTWRFVCGIDSANTIASKIIPTANKLMYGEKPLKFLHTHFRSPQFANINNLFMQKISEASLYRELTIIKRVINDKWVIEIPEQPLPPPYFHTDDSFRELVQMLDKRNEDVQVIKARKRHCSLSGGVILYDRPNLGWVDQEVEASLCALLGNCDTAVDWKVFERIKTQVKPWIFWPRRPSIFELKMYPTTAYGDRDHKTIFIGNIENSVQAQYRQNQSWDTVIDDYTCTNGKNYKYTQEQYLDRLKNAKFGLCLRGYGSKCHREVELMGMGTVPIITPNVCISSYADPPVEGIHFLRVSTPDKLDNVISSVTEEKWNAMSTACVEWYKRNVHSDNAWNTTITKILYS